MAVHICKIVGQTAGALAAPPLNITNVENVATPASDTATAAYAAGGWFMIFNGEAGAIKVARGTTPDADAVAADLPTTSAYFVIAAGSDCGAPIWLAPGDKIEWKAA